MNEDEDTIEKSAFEEDSNASQEEVVPFVSLANNTSNDDDTLS